MSKATLIALVFAMFLAGGCNRSSPTESLPEDLTGYWSGSLTVQRNGRPDETCHAQVYLTPHEHMEEEDIGTSRIDCVSTKTNSSGNVFFRRQGSSYLLDAGGNVVDPETALYGCGWHAVLRRGGADRMQGSWSLLGGSGCPAEILGGAVELSKGLF